MDSKEDTHEIKCPYIATINRRLLDFDKEQICSVTLAKNNIYGCLVCGRYFQGKGRTTPLYNHCLDEAHYVCVNLKTASIYWIPEDVELTDESLYDIKQNLLPKYDATYIKNIEKISKECKVDLNGNKYYPGFIGFKNIKNTEYFNVLIQAFVHLPKFFQHYLQYNKLDNTTTDSLFVTAISTITKRIWNQHSFKTFIDQTESVNLLSVVSHGKFSLESKGNIVDFLNFFMNFNKRHNELIDSFFTGVVEVENFKLIKEIGGRNEGEGEKIKTIDGIEYLYNKKRSHFLYLTLDLPKKPLFKNSQEKITIPVVELRDLMDKYRGVFYVELPELGVKRLYKVKKFPRYLILVFNRLDVNKYIIEKNNTIVHFHLNNLTLEECENKEVKFNLLCNIVFEGENEKDDSYKVQILNKGRNEWFEIKNNEVKKILSDNVLLSECYILFYEKIKQ